MFCLFINEERGHGEEDLNKGNITVHSKSIPHEVLKNLLPMHEMLETQVRSLGQEDPLDEEMATHCSILAWRIPWTEKPGELQFMGLQRVQHD